MKTLSVAILGFGTVGSGVYETIQKQQHRLQQIVGNPVQVTTIVIEHPKKHVKIAQNIHVTTDINAVITDPNIDVVFEAIVGKEPAHTYLAQCIKAGKHVITANKEMFATHGMELKDLAAAHHVNIGFDATTAGGIPIIQTIQKLLNINRIHSVQAILNGTSNYILTEMRELGTSFPNALRQAQNAGYAEADPTNDIEGYDAFYKLMILCELIFNKQPAWKTVKRTGITDIKPEMHRSQARTKQRIKHVAEIKLVNNSIHAKIEPIAIPESHPLYAIEGVNNAIHIETDIVGPLTLAGPGAGSFPTASAMLEDFCQIWKQQKSSMKTNETVLAFP
ncbi:homoserine dehydrogenase [Lentibacillus sp. Marseille-P4043]|uniref:homoserine dehydrogenase n=1 Tax=Lentibacillus sp. Marseille-P4043 TaxID=2040293 RepID=UPI000D0B883B|nr:homoserine dehydrogenase [Lentibacillus sp. Marseille-P4043]